MRLINTKTLQLEEFNEDNRPLYAILSHTWGDQEVTFQHMQDDRSHHSWKAGYRKIAQTCKVALNSGIGYAWVDTCCIDKTSSAELSEAINSMFRWYEDAEICYAYLPDVVGPSSGGLAVVESRWFTRGWTLQELIAPRNLVFYATNWKYINSRSNLSEAIARVTGIEERLLKDNRAKAGSILRTTSIARRMSWAARRQTARTEDLAYCLLGIFDINMPLVYGEGARAFTRLQEQIIQHTDDQSIFAWGLHDGIKPEAGPDTSTSVLAPSPAAFVASGDIVQVDTGEESAPFSLTNRGIRIDLRVGLIRGRRYGIIPCRRNKATGLLMIKLQNLQGNRFFRVADAPVTWRSYLAWKRTPKIPVYLMTVPPPEKHQIPSGSFLVELPRDQIAVHSVSKGYTWSPATDLITRNEPEPHRHSLFEAIRAFGPAKEVYSATDQKNFRRLRRMLRIDPRKVKGQIEDTSGGLQKDSHRWLLNHEGFHRFQNDPQTPLLWISGGPGTGKAMLLCGLIDELSAKPTALSYFFYRASNPRLNSGVAVLRGLLYVLACQRPSLISGYDLLGKQRDEDTSTWEPLAKLVSSTLEDPLLEGAVLVVDALNECSADRESLIEFTKKPSRVKWIISSRDLPDVRDDWNGLSQVTLRLEAHEDVISHFVDTYIQRKPGNLGREKNFDRKTRSILNSPHSSLCKRILAIATVVFCPVTLEELGNLDFELQDVNEELLEELILTCGPFLTLHKKTIDFVHLSAREFLLSAGYRLVMPLGVAHQQARVFFASMKCLINTLREDIYSLQNSGVRIHEVPRLDPGPLLAVGYSCTN
ncbi:HET domain-containing protein [Fusarium falciforme]|uniref:HET domain-containing protein n=1 Tax=Fusarium falciforme TaxID=195108 RepID=UPI002301A582|nr:HET domain-containing protein [Fusarium falciforme]WAO95884.1 HET domain-containing protein [Fusarium falciforme]